jgi:putative redox protein
MSMRANARRVDGGYRCVVNVNGRHAIVTDEPVADGGTDAGPTPHELLPAALASCVATMISMYARTRSWEIGDLAVDVDYDHKATPRRFAVEVRLTGALTDEQLVRLRRVAESCPLRRALETGFEFDERIVTPQRLQAA